MSSAIKSDPGKWKRVVASVKASGKGGNPGQWSARKAQLATQKYKSSGGGYKGPKSADNALTNWTKEEWGDSIREALYSGSKGYRRAIFAKKRETKADSSRICLYNSRQARGHEAG
jgi:hypothetical protein